MPQRPDIRPMGAADVEAADAAAWAALRVHIPQEFVPQDEEERRRRGIDRQRWLLETDPGGAWVAEAGGRVAGVALALMREGVWGLSLLAVDPEHQSRGLGRGLLQAALAYGEGARGAIILSSTDPRAMRRYALSGFALRPCVTAAGAVNRSLLPAGLRSRPGDAEADRDICAAASRAVRGAAHDRDVDASLRAGAELLVHDDGGFALAREGSALLVAARRPEVAQDLLWSCLATAPPGGSVHVDFITAGNDWAVQVALAAGLELSPEGPIFTRGDVGAMAPYLPNGAYL
jgi:GNAT superfamily N-acetyltransferase